MCKLWMGEFGWDDRLPSDLSVEWSKIKSDLDNLSEVSFDRQAIGENVTLYVFSDASNDMYGFTV